MPKGTSGAGTHENGTHANAYTLRVREREREKERERETLSIKKMSRKVLGWSRAMCGFLLGTQ